METLMHSNIAPIEPLETGRPPADEVDMSRRGSRRDGEASRERILHAALRLFAQHGFKNTSTRDIAKAAQVNIASLNYYFGDKAGLYRATFSCLGGPGHQRSGAQHDARGFSRPGIPLAQAMHEFVSEFLQPLALGDMFLWGMRLHYREMVEPTGMWQEALDKNIKPLHAAMQRLLCREFDRLRPDADIERLSHAIIGMAVHVIIGYDVITQVSPQLLRDEAAVQRMADRIALFACDLVHAESRRRENQA
jgi:TetR/AcrR family transcriptional regulator, regulator of cefoperazone and chloramphenicol sensitivity